MELLNKKNLLNFSLSSCFISASTLMMVTVLPLFMKNELHLSNTSLGSIEGIAIFLSFVAKIFSGILSDYINNRKYLIATGCLITVAVKPLFALCYTKIQLASYRIIDRFGKGIRSAPADALVADISRGEVLGTNYGIRQAFYTGGEVLGALFALILLSMYSQNYRLVFWISSIIATIGLMIFLIKVKTMPHKFHYMMSNKWALSDFKKLSVKYWFSLSIVFFLMLGRFSESFVILRLENIGWKINLLPASAILMNFFHALVAYPSGKNYDKIGHLKLLQIAFIIFIIADLLLYLSNNYFLSIVAVIFIGIYMGMTQCAIRALIANSLPSNLRGSGFAIFYLTSGIAVLIANLLAGFFSDLFGLACPFLLGACTTFVAFSIVSIRPLLGKLYRLHTTFS